MKRALFHDDASPRLAIGLMSGTSADGIDAALVEISGCSTDTRVRLLSFLTLPFSDAARARILRVAAGDFGGTEELCLLNFYLGELSADACEAVCAQAGVAPDKVSFVGSHGQTVFHAPDAREYLGRPVRGTLQTGEASVIAERLGCPVVSDFRVRDMAAGGLGAPLVPYTEYLLYRDAQRTVGLQNIGGIGNITVLPKGCSLNDVFAFDTGPGNMVMDALAARLTEGKARFDDGGRLAAQGTVNAGLLAWMMQDPYLSAPPPKTTGREVYGAAYVDALCAHARTLGVSLRDTLSTATRFTAECIREGVERFCPQRPERLIVGGGEEGRHIAPERLETLDAVVYDIQDLGTRFYTFISTLLYVMEDCAAAGRELIVLDRPAPLDGVTVEGGLLEPEYRSFVGAYPLCIRYGLTAGELACMVNAEQKLGCRLTVVPCTGWERTRLFSETGNLWMMPSMGIPHFSTALVYPGTCLFEGTNVSEGRGTACPFEMIGAPFVDGAALAGTMNREGLPGVIFTAACFTPYASKHKGEPCEGVLLHVSDAHAFRPVRTGVTLLYRIREMWPRQFRWKPRDGKPRRFISLLAGCGAFEDEPPAPEALLAAWEADSAAFARRKAAYHLYK